jgi:prophage regulatory protein
MPQAERFLRRPEVERVTGLPRSSIYEQMAAKTFPKPVPLGSGRAVGWPESEIIDWQEKRKAERNKRAAPKRRRQ